MAKVVVYLTSIRPLWHCT